MVEDKHAIKDVGVNPDVRDVVDKPEHEGFDDEQDDVDEVAILDRHRSGMLILTSMAAHTGVGLWMKNEVVEVVVVQNDEDEENDVFECLEDELEVVDVVQDEAVVVEALESDFDVVEGVGDEFDVVDVVQDENGVVRTS